MEVRERLIPAGLVASAVLGAAAAAALQHAGRFRTLDWPTLAALEHPWWLGVGEVVGGIACALGALSLAALGFRHAGTSALATLGVILVWFAGLGAVAIAALHLGLIRAASGGVLDAIRYGNRWDWWYGLGWAFFAIGGVIGLLALGIGVARGNRRLRYPAACLAGSAVLLILFAPLGAVLLLVALVWLAVAISRTSGSTPVPAG